MSDSRMRRAWLYWFLVLLGGGVLSGLSVVVPQEYLAYFVAAIVLALLTAVMFVRPTLLFYFIILFSALSGLLRTFDSMDVGATTLTVSGLRWVWIAGMVVVLLGARFRRVYAPRYMVPFGLFLLWTTIRWLAGPMNSSGLKDILFYGLPPLVGSCAFLEFSTQHGTAESLERVLLLSVLVPVALYAILIPVGLVHLTGNGPQGIVGPRPIALYLVITLSLALANWRYGETPRTKRYGTIVSLIALGVILFTLSRMAAVVALVLFGIHRINPLKPLRALLGVALVAVAVLGILLLIPQYRERSFFTDEIRVEVTDDYQVQGLNTHGRNRMWPATYMHAIENPMVGWGPGSSRMLMAKVLAGTDRERHPHNEYLQIFHDMGMIGLVLWLLAWGPLLLKHWKGWRSAQLCEDHFLARWNMAATFCIAAVLLTAVTGNTFHYAFVMVPSFVIIALADFQCQRRQRA
jgi:O-antigen ligase